LYLLTTGNTIGAVAGILGPIIVAACTDTWPQQGKGWKVAFFITFVLSCITLTLWFLFVKAEIHPVLNSPRKV
jgi:MFS family permease